MIEQPATGDRPIVPDPDADQAARTWIDLSRRRDELETALAGDQPAPKRWTANGRRAARTVADLKDELGEIPERMRSSELRLVATASGSTREWSALSVIPTGPHYPELSLEKTLSQYRQGLPARWVEATESALPRLRVDAQLGRDGQGLHDLHYGLLEQASNGSKEIAAALFEHLPGPLRPLPSRVADLQRKTSHVTLFVSESRPSDWDTEPGTGSGPVIELHDIVIHGQARGLGTAVLIQLCRFADEAGSSITGQLEPGPTAPDERVPIVARWYARHEFSSGGRSPEDWKRGSVITREPRPCNATPQRLWN